MIYEDGKPRSEKCEKHWTSLSHGSSIIKQIGVKLVECMWSKLQSCNWFLHSVCWGWPCHVSLFIYRTPTGFNRNERKQSLWTLLWRLLLNISKILYRDWKDYWKCLRLTRNLLNTCQWRTLLGRYWKLRKGVSWCTRNPRKYIIDIWKDKWRCLRLWRIITQHLPL